jgi:hypothetical protein
MRVRVVVEFKQKVVLFSKQDVGNSTHAAATSATTTITTTTTAAAAALHSTLSALPRT